jgi:hypothetical protein
MYKGGSEIPKVMVVSIQNWDTRFLEKSLSGNAKICILVSQLHIVQKGF